MPTKEDIEQVKVMEFMRQCQPDIPVIHIANQRKCSPVEGRLLKRLGVRAGVSDLFFPRSNDSYKGLWLELKTSVGKPSDLQLEFLAGMIKEGYAGKVCYGAEQAIEVIKRFYLIE